MKRIAIHLLIVLILCGVFFDGYFSLSLLSSGRIWLADSEVYAADDWESVTQDDLVTAFRYYCKSRNLTIDGSIADALTSFTTTTFNNICNTLGIDVTSLQANLKKTVEGNLGLRFLMNQQGVLAYNRIFAEFLQNNDLEVGDQVDDKNLYSGYVYDGHLVFIVNDVTGRNYSLSNIVQSGSFISDLTPQIQSFFNNNFNGWDGGGSHDYTYTWPDGFSVTYPVGITGTENYVSDNKKIFRNMKKALTYGNSFILGREGDSSTHYVYYMKNGDDTKRIYYGIHFTNSLVPGYYSQTSITNNNASPGDYDSEPADVYITTNNNTINNNEYNNNYTIIYNDGDTYITDDDDEPGPSTQPGGGGGGGGDDPDQPTPSGPDLPDWGSPHGTGTIGSDGTFDFDIPFNLPDLNIDWSLKNIGQKFPFCIPSDIVSFYQVLAVEPEAPAIDAHIPLGSFYDWHFQADFAQYDNWARIIRIVEYVGFVITLIYFTVKLVKG